MKSAFAVPLFFLALVTFTAGADVDPVEVPGTSVGMPLHEAVLLGAVEGFTEYLPVSSTGHLLLTQRLLGVGDTAGDKVAADSFAIVIQFGAILAVLFLYAEQIRSVVLGLFGRSVPGRKLLINLIVAFLPAAVIGLLFVDWIKAVLFGLWPVTFAWLVGGLALVLFRSRGEAASGKGLESLQPKEALLIGLIQCIAMWPGTSRSLVTILGGRLVGLSVQASVVFSFLLGMVTLSASTCYDLLNHGGEMVRVFGIGSLVVGVVTGWVTALFAVKWMVAYLQKHGLALFGYYRIALALLTGALLLFNVIES